MKIYRLGAVVWMSGIIYKNLSQMKNKNHLNIKKKKLLKTEDTQKFSKAQDVVGTG